MTEMSLPFADQLPQIEIRSGQGGYQRHSGDNATLCKLLAGRLQNAEAWTPQISAGFTAIISQFCIQQLPQIKLLCGYLILGRGHSERESQESQRKINNASCRNDWTMMVT
jgi:hypothetical protein